MNQSWLNRMFVPAVLSLACTVSAHAVQQGRRGADSTAAAVPTQTVDQRTASLKKMDGFFPVYLDSKADRLYLEITKFDTPTRR